MNTYALTVHFTSAERLVTWDIDGETSAHFLELAMENLGNVTSFKLQRLDENGNPVVIPDCETVVGAVGGRSEEFRMTFPMDTPEGLTLPTDTPEGLTLPTDTPEGLTLPTDYVLREAREAKRWHDEHGKPYTAGVIADCIATIERLAPSLHMD